MIEAVPKGIFSSGFHLQQDGRLIADLDASSWREKADVQIDGETFRLYREGMMSGAFILEWNGSTLARAIKPSVFSDRFELEVGSGRSRCARSRCGRGASGSSRGSSRWGGSRRPAPLRAAS